MNLRRIYLDCDGVLADFDAAFIAKFGQHPRDYEESNGIEAFWRDLRNHAPNFYSELPLMADARELFDAVKHLRPLILTGCPRGGWAEMQKLSWAARYFPGTPTIVCYSKNKRDYMLPGDVLVDDRPQYQNLWVEAGGIFVLHRSASESIAHLRELSLLPASEQV